jgi:hypothetical protein
MMSQSENRIEYKGLNLCGEVVRVLVYNEKKTYSQKSHFSILTAASIVIIIINRVREASIRRRG